MNNPRPHLRGGTGPQEVSRSFWGLRGTRSPRTLFTAEDAVDSLRFICHRGKDPSLIFAALGGGETGSKSPCQGDTRGEEVEFSSPSHSTAAPFCLLS